NTSWTDFALYFFFSSRRRHTRFSRDWSSDVCSSDLNCWLLLEALKLTQVSVAPKARFNVMRPLCLPRAQGACMARAENTCGCHEIGRASCRERVHVAVVAVSCKQENAGQKIADEREL